MWKMETGNGVESKRFLRLLLGVLVISVPEQTSKLHSLKTAL